MKIPFSLSDDDISHPMVYTLTHSNKFFYVKLNDLQNQNEDKLVIVNKNEKESNLKQLIKSYKHIRCFFLIPKEFKLQFEKENLKTIIYPLSPNNILKILNDKESVKQRLGLFLKNNGLLFNQNNNKNVYLTETETGILELLFNKGVVEKATIKEKILKLNKSIDTKSLESHLSRIRKKIKEIGSTVVIVSTNSNKIKIKSIV